MSSGKWTKEKRSILRDNNSTECAVLDMMGASEKCAREDMVICLECPLPKCMLYVNGRTAEGREEIKRLLAMYMGLRG